MDNLEKLKSLIDLTPIYITNHFGDLKTKVDVAFAGKEQHLSSLTPTSSCDSLVKLKENWTLMIKKISLHEKECLYRLKTTNKLTESQMKELNSRIELIKSMPLDLINEYLNSEIDKLEKYFFLNKTVLYLDEDMCDKLNLLYKMDADTTAGKLVIIKDLYLNQNYIKNFKNLNQDLTNENLKCQELIQNLKKNSHNEQILEIHLDLNKINELNLKWHHLTSLKSNLFTDFTSLVSVDFSWNSLQVIKSNLFNDLSTSLQFIDLSWNKLTSIDLNAFKNLLKLETISLNNNEIRSLSGVLSGLSNLINLDLSNNLIERIDWNLFEGAPNLQSIDLHKNKLKVIDASLFKGLDKLIRIDLSSNKLTNLNSRLFNGLMSLTMIELKENHLSLSTLFKLKYLQVFRLISSHSIHSKINIIK